MRQLIVCTALAALVACTGDVAVNDDGAAAFSAALAVWTLEADDLLALRDARRPSVAYPNPAECDALTVAVGATGIEGICERAGLRMVRRGGPANGVPYVMKPVLEAGKLALRVQDMFGLSVTTLPLRDGCVASNGCEVCADEDGELASDHCGVLGGEGPLAPANPSAPASGESTGPAVTCRERGALAYIDTLDANLSALGLSSSGLTLADVARVASFGDAASEWDEFGACDAVQADDDAEEHPTDFMRDGSLRCAYMGEQLLAATCALPAPSDCVSETFERGLLDGHRAWQMGAAMRDADERDELLDDLADQAAQEGVSPESSGSHTPGSSSPELPDVDPGLPECVSSPLVLAGAGLGPLALVSAAQGVDFDLLGVGRQVRTGWVASGALLVFDLDFDGEVSSGRELFGEATRLARGGRAADGFAALAQYDRFELGGNDDGGIDAADSVFSLLDVWRDADRDGITDPGELVPAAVAGVSRIELGWVRGHDAMEGNIVGLEGAFVSAKGEQGAVYDVWFAYGAPTPDS